MTKSELAEVANSRATLVVNRPGCIFKTDKHRIDLGVASGHHELATSWKHN